MSTGASAPVQLNQPAAGTPGGNGAINGSKTDPLSYDGAFVLDATDVMLPSAAPEDELKYSFTRRYDSHDSHRATVLGHGWSHSYDEYIPAPPGPLPGASDLPETSWYCKVNGTLHRFAASGAEDICPDNPIPVAPVGPRTDRIHDINGDAYLRRGTAAFRYRSTGPEVNGVTTFKTYPDQGQRLEFQRASTPQNNEVRLITPATGVTRVYRPLYGPAAFVLPLPPGVANITASAYPNEYPTFPGWWRSRFWHIYVANGPNVLLGYYLSEIRNESGQKLSFAWDVVGVGIDTTRSRHTTETIERGPNPGARPPFDSTPTAEEGWITVDHNLPTALGRIRMVTDTTGRQIHYHYRQQVPKGSPALQAAADWGTDYPELWCVSLESHRATCTPGQEAGVLPAFAIFDYGLVGADGQPALSQDLAADQNGPDPQAPRRRSTLALQRVLDAQGQTVQRYDYAIGYPYQIPNNLLNPVLPNKERELVCAQTCGEAPPPDPIYGTPRQWPDPSSTPTDSCGIDSNLGGTPVLDAEPFRFGFNNPRHADCAAILGGGEACVAFGKQGPRITTPALTIPLTGAEDYSLEDSYALCAEPDRRWNLYQNCTAALHQHGTCGGYVDPDGYGAALPRYSCDRDGLNCTQVAGNASLVTIGDRFQCDSGGQNCRVVSGSRDRNVCVAQCMSSHLPKALPAGKEYVYGDPVRQGYNLVRVYNSLGQIEVENEYNADLFDFAHDRVTRQRVNVGEGLESASIDVQYFDLERGGGANPHAQVLSRSNWVQDASYQCGARDAQGACASWLAGAAQTVLPAMAARTVSVHGDVTVAYLNDRSELIRVDLFADEADTSADETTRYGYDARGRLVNVLDASGVRTLREYTGDVAGALLGETSLASARAPFEAPDAETIPRTVYSYATNGKLQETRAYSGATLKSMTSIVRDAQQRLERLEVRYGAASGAPTYGTTYVYESPTRAVPLRVATWFRAGGSTNVNVHSISRRRASVSRPYSASLAAYPYLDNFDARGRVVPAGSDVTAVLPTDTLISTEEALFDEQNALVIGTIIPGRSDSVTVFNPARRAEGSSVVVQTAPGVSQRRESLVSYCEISPSNGLPISVPPSANDGPGRGACSVLPRATEETWTDPLTDQAQVRVTTMRYDALNQVVSTTVSTQGAHAFVADPANARTTCRHVAWDGRELDTINAEGEWTRYEYDAAGRRVATRKGYWNEVPVWAQPCQAQIQQRASEGKTQQLEVERLEYHAGGFMKARTVDGLRTTYTVDGYGRVVGETDPTGRQTRRGYDAQGRVVWLAAYRSGVTPGTGKPLPTAAGLLVLEEMSYDAMGRQTQAKSWDLDRQQAVATDTSYTDRDRTVTVMSPTGVRTDTRSDAAGRVVSTVSQLDGFDSEQGPYVEDVLSSTSTVYDWSSNTVASTTQSNLGPVTTTMHLDGNGQVREVYEGSTRLSTQENDVFGRVVRRTRRGQGEERVVYDVFGQPVRQTQAVSVAAGAVDPECPLTGTCTSYTLGLASTMATAMRSGSSSQECARDSEPFDPDGSPNPTYGQYVDCPESAPVCDAAEASAVSSLRSALTASCVGDGADATTCSAFFSGITVTAQSETAEVEAYLLGGTQPRNRLVCRGDYTLRHAQPRTLPVDAEVASQLRVDYSYDRVGRQTGVVQWGTVDANGWATGRSETRYGYDALGRVVEVTEPAVGAAAPRKATTTYLTRTVTVENQPRVQATGSIERQTSFAGTNGWFYYDGATGRLTTELFRPAAGADVQQYELRRDWTYDDCASYPAGSVGACGYGRVIRGRVTHALTNGNTDTANLPRAVTTENRFDTRGRLIRTWNDVSNVPVIHGYDLLGEWATTQVDSKVITHLMDKQGRLDAVDLKVGSDPTLNLATYDYYAGTGDYGYSGPKLGARYGDGSTDVWSYDGLRRTSRLQVRNSANATLASRREAYGEHGIALMREHQFLVGTALQTTTDVFRVDEAGRLLAERTGLPNVAFPMGELTAGSAALQQATNLVTRSVTPNLGPSWRRYDFDGRGNWSARETQDASNRTYRAGVRSNERNEYVSFDLRDLATPTFNTLRDFGVNAEGDNTFVPSYAPGAAAGVGVEFTYDLFDHPLTLTNRTSATSSTTVRATYDAFGYRVLEESGTQRNYLLWSGDEIVAFGSSTTAAAPSAATYHLRAVGSELDSTIAVLIYGGGHPAYRLYHHQWADGSTLATTSQGALDAGVRYSAWGEIAQTVGVGSGSVGSGYRRWLWKGAFYDQVTRTYTMRAREFSPQLGRFLSTDPIGQDGGLNVYAFGMGRSDLIDPMGTNALSPPSSGFLGPGETFTASPEAAFGTPPQLDAAQAGRAGDIAGSPQVAGYITTENGTFAYDPNAPVYETTVVAHAPGALSRALSTAGNFAYNFVNNTINKVVYANTHPGEYYNPGFTGGVPAPYTYPVPPKTTVTLPYGRGHFTFEFAPFTGEKFGEQVSLGYEVDLFGKPEANQLVPTIGFGDGGVGKTEAYANISGGALLSKFSLNASTDSGLTISHKLGLPGGFGVSSKGSLTERGPTHTGTKLTTPDVINTSIGPDATPGLAKFTALPSVKAPYFGGVKGGVRVRGDAVIQFGQALSAGAAEGARGYQVAPGVYSIR